MTTKHDAFTNEIIQSYFVGHREGNDDDHNPNFL